MILDEWEGVAPRVWADSWGVRWVEVHDTVGSTNRLLAEMAEAGAADTTVVIAEEQSGGRGRHGAEWFSPAGTGLWLSYLAAPPGSAALLPLLAGLAGARAIEACVAVGVGIKWPNDLVIDGMKVG